MPGVDFRRALPPDGRVRVHVALTAWEFAFLVRELELRAEVFARYPDLTDVAQALCDRVCELREEAGR
jgi:hypothetical protein